MQAQSPDIVPDDADCQAEQGSGTITCRDLKAQEVMATAAIAQVVLTAVGLLLVLGTLIYTRDASAAARAAVGEAEKATKAAEAAVEETRLVGHAQMRAYVRITGGTAVLAHPDPGMTEQRIRPKISIRVKNYGQTPALRFQWSVMVRYYPPMGAPFLGSLGFVGDSWGTDIGCGEEPTFTLNVGSSPLDDIAMGQLANGELYMDIVIRYFFIDVFKNRIEDERVFTAFATNGGIGIELPLQPHVFDKEAIDRLIEANSPESIARIAAASQEGGNNNDGHR